MSKFVSGPALLAKCRAGRGAIVVLEGETVDDDPFFYNLWFGDLAREVSFEPQNGWAKVVSAVKELREAIPDRHVFGIIDRDFAEEATLSAQAESVPADGVFRTRWYTLENYLLEPKGWQRCAQALCRGNAPEGWRTAAEIAARIDEAYRRCLRVGAYNRVVWEEHGREPGHGGRCLEYVDHSDGLKDAPEQRLLEWGKQRGAPRPLDEMFEAHLAQLEREPPELWPCWVSGKAVLKSFLAEFPAWKGQRPTAGVLISLYLDKHPTPPPELADLIGRLVAASRR